MRKILSILLSITIAATLIPTFSVRVSAEPTIKYLDENGEEQDCSSYSGVSNEDTTWGTSGNTAWYSVSGTVTIDHSVTVLGHVHLILENGCNLSVKGKDKEGIDAAENGIFVSGPGNSLTIYGQSLDNEMGSLTVAGGKTDDDDYKTAIGVTVGLNNGANITINGGKIIAEGADDSLYDYAICGENVYINGGNVIAPDGRNGIIFANNLLEVSNGDVNAKTLTSQNTVSIVGGNVKVSYGISAHDISISGENTIVSCSGEYNGLYASDDIFATISISGGKVTAKGFGEEDPGEGDYVYGIKSTGTISITGGEVIAEGVTQAIKALNVTTGNSMLVVAGENSSSATMLSKAANYATVPEFKNKYAHISPAVCYVDANKNGKLDGEETEYTSVQSAIDTSDNIKTIVLVDDDMENVYIPSEKEIILDLNGHVLKAGPGQDIHDIGNLYSKNNSVIVVRGNLTLVDSDSSTSHYFKYSKTGAWTLYDDATSAEKNSAKTIDEINSITAEDTIINVPGGVITGGKASIIFTTAVFNSGNSEYEGNELIGAGGVFVVGWNDENDLKDSAGNFTIKGGNIIGNESIYDSDGPCGVGGGVFSMSSNVTMSGGNILGNYSNSTGGGIACYTLSSINNAGSFIMTGGTIAHNISDFAGGVSIGVDVVATVGGTAKIYGNKALDIGDNFPVLESYPFALGTSTNGTDGNGVVKPSDGMNIGITIVNDNGDSTTGAFTNNGELTDKQYFFSDVDTYYVKYVEDHLELGLTEDITVKIDENITNGKIIVDDQEAIEEAIVKITPIPNNGYKLDKITVKDKEGNLITVNSDNTFAMPSNSGKFPVTVSATFKKKATAGYKVVNTGVVGIH